MSKIHIRDFLTQYYVADKTQTGFDFKAKDIKFHQGKSLDPMSGEIDSLPVCWFNLQHFGIKKELNHIKRNEPNSISKEEFIARTNQASAWVKCENGFVELDQLGAPLHSYPEDGKHIIFRTPRGNNFSYIKRYVENGAQQNARIHLAFEDTSADNELNFVFGKQIDKKGREGKKYLLTITWRDSGCQRFCFCII